MRKVLVLIMVIAVLYGWYSGKKAPRQEETTSYKAPRQEETTSYSRSEESPISPVVQYQCLGKTRCTEMTSCEEARFYLQNCPNVKIDGDRDGIPCEGQFCGH